MADVLTPEQAQSLVQRAGAGETLPEAEASALAEFRHNSLEKFREFTAAFAGITEEEILTAFFEDERKEREIALKAAAGKLRSHAQSRQATPAPRS